MRRTGFLGAQEQLPFTVKAASGPRNTPCSVAGVSRACSGCEQRHCSPAHVLILVARLVPPIYHRDRYVCGQEAGQAVTSAA